MINFHKQLMIIVILKKYELPSLNNLVFHAQVKIIF